MFYLNSRHSCLSLFVSSRYHKKNDFIISSTVDFENLQPPAMEGLDAVLHVSLLLSVLGSLIIDCVDMFILYAEEKASQ